MPSIKKEEAITKEENRLQKKYKEEILPNLKKKFGYKNDLEVPKLVKIVLNRGINVDEGKSDNIVEDLSKDLEMLSGQKSIVKKAKKSIATFKLRDGMPNGIMVTLRKERMYAFFDKFVSVVSPRIRDFSGFKISGDGHGNFTVGIPDQRIFIEVENKTGKGLSIALVTSANTDEEGKSLLEELGFPFFKKQ